MLLIFLRTCTRAVVVLAMVLVPSFGWAFKPLYAGDAYFAHGSSVLQGEQIDKLEKLKCLVGARPLESLSIIGHASSRERKPRDLSLARAAAVKDWFVANTGWNANKIYVEGKGDKQHMADDATAEASAKNRWTDLELLIVATPHDPSPSKECYVLAWEKSFLALEGESAMVVARSLARTGWVQVPALYRSALEHRRDDLLNRLPRAGIATTRTQQIEIARMALAFGKFGYFTNWLRYEGRTLDGNQRDALLQAACRGEGDATERAAVIRLLHAVGGVSRTREGLQCAVTETRQAQVVEAYLAGGAHRFIDADMVVDAGRSPAVLDRLLVWGGNPASRTAHGTTLFHTSRLEAIGDVQRLLAWGLDINAKGRTYPSNPDTTPLREAVAYASVEILDFMKQAGADVEGAGDLQQTKIIANQLWLVRNVMPLPTGGETVVRLALQGEVALPVLEALHERGVDLGATAWEGESALRVAIERYEPTMVRFLVARGVPLQVRMKRGGAVQPALEAAHSLSEMVPPVPCPPYGACPAVVPSPPVVDPERQRKKNEILQILGAAAS